MADSVPPFWRRQAQDLVQPRLHLAQVSRTRCTHTCVAHFATYATFKKISVAPTGYKIIVLHTQKIMYKMTH